MGIRASKLGHYYIFLARGKVSTLSEGKSGGEGGRKNDVYKLRGKRKDESVGEGGQLLQIQPYGHSTFWSKKFTIFR